MEHVEETVKELVSFTTSVGRTLANHREQLQRHEEILHAQFKGGSSHAHAIETLRKDMLALTELVNSQSALLASMQRVVLRIAKSLGLDPEETAGTIN